MTGPGYREAEVRAQDAWGARLRTAPAFHADSLEAWLTRGTPPVRFAAIRVTALAIHGVSRTVEEKYPWVLGAPVAFRREAERRFAVEAPLLARQRARFHCEVPGGRVVEIPGGRHYVYLSHPREVAATIRSMARWGAVVRRGYGQCARIPSTHTISLLLPTFTLTHMSSELLTGARLKIQWGNEAIARIALELGAALTGDRLMLFLTTDPATGDRLLKVKLKEALPDTIKNQVGIAVHNLRSSLDATAIALARTAKLPRLDHIYFPMGKNAASFEVEAKNKLRGIDQRAVDVVRGFKPYNGGNDLLWGLHRLSISDKHYDVIPTGSGGNLNLVQDLRIEHARIGIILGGGRLDEGFAISNLGTYGTFAPMGNLPTGVPNLGVTADAVFGNVEVFDGQRIYPTLVRAHRLVTTIVDALEPYCAPA